LFLLSMKDAKTWDEVLIKAAGDNSSTKRNGHCSAFRRDVWSRHSNQNSTLEISLASDGRDNDVN
jgi:hypothetical protein